MDNSVEFWRPSIYTFCMSKEKRKHLSYQMAYICDAQGKKKRVWKTERHVPTDTNSLVFKLCHNHFFSIGDKCAYASKRHFKNELIRKEAD